jgi:hypothetical protein
MQATARMKTTTGMLTQYGRYQNWITGYALSQFTHRIQSKTMFWETYDLYMEWLGMVD